VENNTNGEKLKKRGKLSMGRFRFKKKRFEGHDITKRERSYNGTCDAPLARYHMFLLKKELPGKGPKNVKKFLGPQEKVKRNQRTEQNT